MTDGTDTGSSEGLAERVIEEIRDALDMEEDETLFVQTPQFERQDGIEPGEPPMTSEAMDRLKDADRGELKALGLRPWSEGRGLWLLPYEWHPHLPPDYPLLSILGEWTCRKEMADDPDKRRGVLSVGIVPYFEEE